MDERVKKVLEVMACDWRWRRDNGQCIGCGHNTHVEHAEDCPVRMAKEILEAQ